MLVVILFLSMEMVTTSYIISVNADCRTYENKLTVDDFSEALDPTWDHNSQWGNYDRDFVSPPYSLKSPELNFAGICYINKNIDMSNPGRVTFFWKKKDVSYLSGLSELYFLVDGVKRANYTNLNHQWTEESCNLAKGAHTLSWAIKVNSVGSICAYPHASASGLIDDVKISEEICHNVTTNDTVYVDNMGELRDEVNETEIKKIILLPNKYYGSLYLNAINGKTLESEIPFQAEIISNKTDLYVIGLEKSSYVTIRNLELNGSNGGIYLQDSSFCSISGNKITANTDYAINLINSIGNTINSNMIKKINPINCCAVLQCNSHENIFTDNYFEVPDLNNYYLVYLDSSCNNKIFNLSNGYVFDKIKYHISNGNFNPPYSGCTKWR